jgi:predicted dithiol-disulfide oxidoreductase (DUF899 family)
MPCSGCAARSGMISASLAHVRAGQVAPALAALAPVAPSLARDAVQVSTLIASRAASAAVAMLARIGR